MTDNPRRLMKIAAELAGNAKFKATALQKEKLTIEARLREIETELHAANLAHERLNSFVPVRGNDLQCPGCWIDREAAAALRPVGGGTRTEDFFKCRTCGPDLSFPA